MPIIIVSSRFTRQLKKLLRKNPELENVVKGKIEQISKNPRHPTLRLHKLSGQENWSISISNDLRIIIHWDGDEMYLLGLGSHDQVY